MIVGWMTRRSMTQLFVAGPLAVAGLIGCESKPPASTATPARESHRHAHTAPHGGLLVELGEHFANLELLLDSATGELTAYVLSAHAEEAVRISQSEIELTLEPPGRPPIELRLHARANALTGEMVGDTSEFAGQSDELKGMSLPAGRVSEIAVRGQRFAGVEFSR